MQFQHNIDKAVASVIQSMMTQTSLETYKSMYRLKIITSVVEFSIVIVTSINLY